MTKALVAKTFEAINALAAAALMATFAAIIAAMKKGFSVSSLTISD